MIKKAKDILLQLGDLEADEGWRQRTLLKKSIFQTVYEKQKLN